LSPLAEKSLYGEVWFCRIARSRRSGGRNRTLWSGVAGAANKDIWVFEAHEDHGKLTVLIPHLRYHVCFEYSDPWLAYIRTVVSSYDDSHVLPAISVGVATGVATDNPVAGILAGGIVALLVRGNKLGPPAGLADPVYYL
jgi:hypothetical protein